MLPRARAQRGCSARCMRGAVHGMVGDATPTVNRRRGGHCEFVRTSADLHGKVECISLHRQGGRQKGVKLTVHGGGAATAADGEVWAVSDVDLHDREMVKSSS
jgi:hypothetical protein